jgi:hypothetical protein
MNAQPAKRSAYDALVGAAETLSENPFWLDLLAENLYWASMEGFLQSSLLGAFNSGTHGFVADRERALAPRGAFKPDMLVMERSSGVHEEWWAAREEGGPNAQARYLRLAQAVVQLKVAWTPGNARGSAMLTSKAAAVKSDVVRLRQCLKDPSLGIVGVLVSGFHPESDGAEAIRSSLDVIKGAVANEVDSGNEVMLLARARPTRWNPVLENGRALFSTLWLARVRQTRGAVRVGLP